MAGRATEVEPLILAFSHEKQRPREKDALEALKKVASLVKPIMRARNWKVGTLVEFYPEQQNLLGLNVNRGQRICLRLRYAGDANQFLPMEQVVDTMLHELAHNVHGPHDAKFHALWDQLRDEHEALIRKGYTGEGFLSDGKRLGGRHVPHDEAKRLARASAERRRAANALAAGSGQKLGGAGPRPGQDIRRIIVDAIERRAKITKGCGATDHNDAQMQRIADQATRNGFRTAAEEDAANEAAIAQALWELVQEDEKLKYGKDYQPPTPLNPSGTLALSTKAPGYTDPGPQSELSSRPKRPRAHSSDAEPSSPPPIPLSSKPAMKDDKGSPKLLARRVPRPGGTEGSVSTNPPFAIGSGSVIGSQISRSILLKWICPTCTLHNTETHLQCDACSTQRPPSDICEYVHERKEQTILVAQSSRKKNARPTEWTCHVCTTKNEQQYWMCATCGTMCMSK